ncbi:MAG: hypothetical protein WCQ99_11860 [Pseudomonadota bacterium]
MQLLSFDIEISDVFELKKYEDIEKYAPFHISVASTAIHGGEEKLWYSLRSDGTPLDTIESNRAREMLFYLQDMQAKDYMVCAWNGLQFDLRWLGFAAEDAELAANVALKSYDPMFQFFNQCGFPVALAAVGSAMGIKQEKLMHGSEAPVRWQQGRYTEVMEYVLMDARITNEIALAIMQRWAVSWVTTKKIIKSIPMIRLKTVEEVIREPMADQSWMSTPLPKNSFYRWFPEHLKIKG